MQQYVQQQDELWYAPPVTSQPVTGAGVQVYETPSGVKVRTMTAQDAEFAGRLTIDAFQGKFEHAVGSQNMGLLYPAAADDYSRMMFRYHHVLIAEYNGLKAGLVDLKFHGEREGESSRLWNRLSCWPLCRLGCLAAITDEKPKLGQCYVDHICVADGYRGKGIGQALLTAADQLAMQQNCNVIYLWVATSNRAMNLYTRHGYTVKEAGSMCGCAKCITGLSRFARMEKRLT